MRNFLTWQDRIITKLEWIGGKSDGKNNFVSKYKRKCYALLSTFYEGGGPFNRVLSAYPTSRNKRPPIQKTLIEKFPS